MNMLTSPAATMNSQEIADLVNSAHADVRRSIERLADRGVITLPPTAEVPNPRSGPKTINVYQVGERESYIVVAQLSPEFTARLVDYWQAHKNEPVRLPTTTETLIQMLTLQAEVERRQLLQQQALDAIDARVARVEDTASLTSKPQNTETLSDVRVRINRKYGLPPRIVDFVLMKITYHIRPFGMVKNSHENAQGSSFAVYHSIDVTKLFKRFVAECEQVTETLATHTEIDGRFKLVRK